MLICADAFLSIKTVSTFILGGIKICQALKNRLKQILRDQIELNICKGKLASHFTYSLIHLLNLQGHL